MTTRDDQLSGWAETLQSTSQNQTCTKRRSWSLVVCCWSDPPQFLESWWNHYNWEVCSANCWDAQNTAMTTAHIGQQHGPNSSPRQCLTTLHTTNTSKVEWIWLLSFVSFTIFTWPLANQLPLLQASWWLFAGKMQEAEKCFPRICQILKHRFLHYRNKQTYVSLAKICWLQWLLFLLIKLCLSLVIMI